jgi:hypothetical protein
MVTVCHLSLLPAALIATIQSVKIDYLWRSFLFMNSLVSVVFQTLVYYDERSAALDLVFTEHHGVISFQDSQNRTKGATWCMIAALPKAKFATQWQVFSEPYGTEV